jgi:hypothetical protein
MGGDDRPASPGAHHAAEADDAAALGEGAAGFHPDGFHPDGCYPDGCYPDGAVAEARVPLELVSSLLTLLAAHPPLPHLQLPLLAALAHFLGAAPGSAGRSACVAVPSAFLLHEIVPRLAAAVAAACLDGDSTGGGLSSLSSKGGGSGLSSSSSSSSSSRAVVVAPPEALAEHASALAALLAHACRGGLEDGGRSGGSGGSGDSGGSGGSYGAAAAAAARACVRVHLSEVLSAQGFERRRTRRARGWRCRPCASALASRREAAAPQSQARRRAAELRCRQVRRGGGWSSAA